MRRKVNRVGQNTLTVSIPAGWARQNNIKFGDDVEVEGKANSLVISRCGTTTETEITIDVKSKDRFLKRFLAIPYIKGYDSIRVNYTDPSIYFKVQETMNRILLGFEIIEHGKNSCLLKNMTGESDIDFDKNQRRYVLQVKGVVDGLKDAIDNKDFDELEHVLIMDKSIDKLCLFMRRVLNKKGYKEEAKGKTIYYVNALLETISDRCRDVSKHILEKRRFPSKDFTNSFNLLYKSFTVYYEMFYKPDMDKIVDLKKMNGRLRKSIEEAVSKKSSDILLYYQLLVIAGLLHNLTEEL